MADPTVNWWRKPLWEWKQPPLTYPGPPMTERPPPQDSDDTGEAIPVPVPAGSPIEGTSRRVNWAPAAPTAPAAAPEERPPAQDVSLGVTQYAEAPGERRERAESALSVLMNPDRALSGIAAMEKERDALGRATAEAIALAKTRNKMRQDFEIDAQDAMVAYREALGLKRPDIPELQKPPGVPDLKIRPWLNPEGKDALSIIAQSLGMLATGIGGLVIGAPKTAMALFTKAAEDWRRDEIDRAESNWKSFQAEVGRIQTENQQALQVYDLKDKEYGANQLSKRAAVITELDRLKLHDASSAAAMVPLELAIQGHHQALDATAKIQHAIAQYAGVVFRYDLARNGMPKSLGGFIGELQATTQRLQTEQDPEERKRLETRKELLEQGYKKLRDDRQAELIAYGRSQAGLGVAGKGLEKMQGRVEMVARLGDRLEALDKAYAVLQAAGLLPSKPGKLAEWVATIKQNVKSQSPEVQEAFGVVNNFFSQINVTEARTILDEVGTRFKGAYGTFSDHPMMPYSAWVGIRKQMAEMLAEADRTYRGYERLYRKTIGGPIGGGARPPSDEEEDE